MATTKTRQGDKVAGDKNVVEEQKITSPPTQAPDGDAEKLTYQGDAGRGHPVERNESGSQ